LLILRRSWWSIQESRVMTNPKVATLHFVCGKIASGKTTLARRLAEEHAAVIFCEDEWLTRLNVTINTFEDYLTHARTLRSALAPHVIQLLKREMSVVLDFPANTPRDRAWMRSLFENGRAQHLLHFVDASDELCKLRLRFRNETKPEGLYWGYVPEANFDAITRHLVPPSEAEGFNVIRYDAQNSEPH
jgi:predicted kinase